MRQCLRVRGALMELHPVPPIQNNSQNWTLNQINSQNWTLNHNNSENWFLNQKTQPEWEEDKKSSRLQCVRHPLKLFTYNTLGQPTICSVQTGSNLIPGWSYPPFQLPWMLAMRVSQGKNLKQNSCYMTISCIFVLTVLHLFETLNCCKQNVIKV